MSQNEFTEVSINQISKTGMAVHSVMQQYLTMLHSAPSEVEKQLITEKLGLFVAPLMINYNLSVIGVQQAALHGVPIPALAHHFDNTSGYVWVISSINLFPKNILQAAVDSAQIPEEIRGILTEQIEANLAPINFILAQFLVSVEKWRFEMARAIVSEFLLHMNEFLVTKI